MVANTPTQEESSLHICKFPLFSTCYCIWPQACWMCHPHSEQVFPPQFSHLQSCLATHPEVCLTGFPGISQCNEVNDKVKYHKDSLLLGQNVFINYIFFIHSSADGYLGWFHFLASVNSFAINRRLQISIQDPIFSFLNTHIQVRLIIL